MYQRPYDPLYPMICMDESNKQMVGEVRPSIPCEPGMPLRVDDEYVRNGVANIFMAVEPLGGKRFIAITERRTRLEWAEFIKDLLDNRYPDAKKIRLVMDNLNTHEIASLYERFSPEDALRLANRLEIHYTPKHGSWLNMAEIELSALVTQCLDRRIPDMDSMRKEVNAWQKSRNGQASKISWQFTTKEARVKLRRLYPTT